METFKSKDYTGSIQPNFTVLQTYDLFYNILHSCHA